MSNDALYWHKGPRSILLCFTCICQTSQANFHRVHDHLRFRNLLSPMKAALVESPYDLSLRMGQFTGSVS